MELLRHLAVSNRDIIIVTLILSLTTFTMGSMRPVLPLYAQSLGATVEQWGLIAAMWSVAMAIGEPLWGWFHDHVDPVAPLLFRAASGALVFLGLWLPSGVWPIFLLNFWRGFSDAASWPVSRSLVGQTTSPSRIGLAMAVLATGARLGSAVGAFAGGQVANTYGYRPTLVLMTAVSLSAGILVVSRFSWPRLVRSRGVPAKSSPPAPPGVTLKRNPGLTLRWHKSFLVLASVTVLSSFGWWGALTFLPFVVTASLQRTVADAGMLFNVSEIVTGVLMIPLGRLGDKVGRRTMSTGGLAVSALSLMGVAFADSYAQLMALIVIGAVGQAALRPALLALVSEVSSSVEQGRMMGVFGMCEDVGGTLGPALGSLTWRWGGQLSLFWLAVPSRSVAPSWA